MLAIAAASKVDSSGTLVTPTNGFTQRENTGSAGNPNSSENEGCYAEKFYTSGTQDSTFTITTVAYEWAGAIATFKGTDDRYWTGATSTDFETVGNWSLTSGGASTASVPVNGNTAIFDGNGAVNCALATAQTVTAIDIKSTYANTFTKDAGSTLTSPIVSVAGGTFTVAGTLTANTSVTVSGGTLDASGTLNSSGTVTITNGTVSGTLSVTGTLDVQNGTVSNDSGATIPTMTMSGGTYTNSNAAADKTTLTLSGGTFTDNGGELIATLNLSSTGVFVNNAGTACDITSLSMTGGTLQNNDSGDRIDITNAAVISGGTLTFSGGSMYFIGGLTTSGTVALGASPSITLGNTGGADLTNNGTLTIASGTWTMANNTADAVTAINVINNGTITHSGTGWDFNDIGLNNAGGATITYSGTALTVERSFNQSGTFNLAGITVTMDGSSNNDDATLTCGSTLAGSIAINKTTASADTVLGSSCTIAGSFTRTNGPVTNPGSAYTLEIQSDFSTSTSDTFGGANMTTRLGGSSAQTFTSAATISGPMVVNKGASSVLTVSGALTLGSTLDVTSGVLKLGTGDTDDLTTGGTLTIGASGYLWNTGAADIALGGNVVNSGAIQLDGTGAGCGEVDAISITSTLGTRDWSGSGAFRLTDVTCANQTASVPIVPTSSTNTGSTCTSPWSFTAACNGITPLTSQASSQTGNNTALLAWSHTSAAGSDELLMVGVAIRTTTSTVTGITFGAQSLTQVTSGAANNGTDARVEMWYLLAPTPSTNTVTVTLSAASNVTAGALTFTGVNQSKPMQAFVSATGTSSTPSLTYGGGESAQRVFDVLAMRGTNTVSSSSQTQQWTNTTSDGTGAGSTATGAASVTLGYTMSGSDSWVMGAVSLLGSPPTAARLISFGAERREAGVSLSWRTGFEVDNLGFHVYREETGLRVRVSPSLIAGSALFAGVGTALMSGRSYGWFDALDTATHENLRYWLEEVDLEGKSTFHGPISPEIAGSRTVTEIDKVAAHRSALLTGLGREPPILSGWEGREKRAPWREPPPVVEPPDILSQPWVKLRVRKEGWYRVELSELRAAGITAPLRLYADGQEQAISVVNDGIEFYGIGADTPWTDERAYILSSARMGSAKGVTQRETNGVGAALPATSFPFTIERRDRSIYFAALTNGEAENFFGPVISKEPVELSFLVERLSSGTPASVELALQGVNEVSHRVEVSLNGTSLGIVAFEGKSRGVLMASLPDDLLVEGENKVRLVPSEQGSDTSLVDFVRMTYPRKYQVANNLLRISLPTGQSVTVRGFSRSDIRAMDVTDASAPTELIGTVSADGERYALTLVSTDGAGEVLVFTNDQVQRPASLLMKPAGGLEATPADFIILSPRAFMNALEPLVERRQNDGFRVQLVDVEDVYDAFGFGQKSPFAIRNFLETAKAVGARFVLLVGDATFDPRNYLGLGAYDFTPTKIVATAYNETASDDWLADFDGDALADLAVGRLPARTEDEVTILVQKLINYQTPDRPSSVLVLSGKKADTDFAGGAERLLADLPAGLARHVRADAVGIDGARRGLLSFLKEGLGIVEYLGHGSVELWSDGLLDGADATTLEDTRPSIFVPLTCLNGFFHDLYTESLAETLLKTPRGGALAVWASSGLTHSEEQILMGKEFVQRLLNGSSTLGEAAMAAKALAREDVRRTWILFGDPSLRVAPAAALDPGSPTSGSSGCGCRVGGTSFSSGLAIFGLFTLIVCCRRHPRLRTSAANPRRASH
jgi:hypothetical protein